MIPWGCAKCFLIYSISFKNRAINPWVIFSLQELDNTWNLTAILITRMKHQRRLLLKENTIDCKHKSAEFSSFSLPDPWNHTQNLVKKLFLDPFLKNQNWTYLWVNSQSKVLYSLFSLQSDGYRNILKVNCKTLAFTSCKAFLTNKKRFGTRLPASFSTWFLKKNIFLVIFYYLTKFYYLFSFKSWAVFQYVYCDCLLTRLWSHEFWSEPYLPHQGAFL